MSAAIHPRQTPGWYDVMLGVGCTIVVHLLAAWLLLRQTPAAPVEMPRILQISLIPAPLQTQPPAPQPPTPIAAPTPPDPPQPQRRQAPKVAVVKQAMRSPAPVEPHQPAAPQTIASTALPALPTASTAAATVPIETVTEPRFDAAYLNNPTPAYPPLSRRLSEQGRVLMRVYVDPQGAPAQVELRQSSGHPRLDSAAEAAVRHWRFVPARQGSDAIGAWVLVPISFSLRS